MYSITVNGIRASEPCGLNKGCGLKFHVGSQVRQEKPEEGWSKYNNQDEDYSLKIWNDKNHQALSQKVKQLFTIFVCKTGTTNTALTYQNSLWL